jgi:hypothetical protein
VIVDRHLLFVTAGVLTFASLQGPWLAAVGAPPVVIGPVLDLVRAAMSLTWIAAIAMTASDRIIAAIREERAEREFREGESLIHAVSPEPERLRVRAN